MRYDRFVVRAMNMMVAAVLAAAVAVLPLVRQRCADDCSSRRGSAATAPACHHGSQPLRVGSVPLGCDHDHDGTVIVAIKTGTTEQSLSRIDALVVVAPTPAATSAAVLRAPFDVQTIATAPFVRQSPPLRV
jgi:hypothetical protein